MAHGKCHGMYGRVVSNWAGTVLLAISVIPAIAPLVSHSVYSLSCQHSCLLCLYKLWPVGRVSVQYALWRLWAGFLLQAALITDVLFILSMHCQISWLYICWAHIGLFIALWLAMFYCVLVLFHSFSLI